MIFKQAGNTKGWILSSGLVLVVGAGLYVGNQYPFEDNSEMTGTIAPAERYQASQIGSQDVVLGDEALAQFMQTDAYQLIVEKPELAQFFADERVLALASDERYRGLSADERVVRLATDERLAGLMADERVAMLMADERVQRLMVDERFAKLASDERFAGLSADERIARLSTDERRVNGLSADERRVNSLSADDRRATP